MGVQVDPESGYAGVYDLIHERPYGIVATQLAFLGRVLPPSPCRVLDAGCGTGRHLGGLAALGYALTGLDGSRAMLDRACIRLAGAQQAPGIREGQALTCPLRHPAWPPAGTHPGSLQGCSFPLTAASNPADAAAGDLAARDPARRPAAYPNLVLADLRRPLPFQQAFGAVVCLESPLAYLSDLELPQALAGLRQVLAPGGILIADTYDYVGTLGTGTRRPGIARFPFAGGRAAVRETHRYDARTGLWRMTQAFIVHCAGRRLRFTVRHDLHIRSATAYTVALRRAGFELLAGWDRYPGMPAELSAERRIILLARAPGGRTPVLPLSPGLGRSA